MKTTTDFRMAAWREVEARLTGLCRATWEGLIRHGPCTTRRLAAETGIDLLTVRPRTTELLAMGLARLAVDQPFPREGVYEAVGIAEAQAMHERNRIERSETQLQMRLTA